MQQLSGAFRSLHAAFTPHSGIDTSSGGRCMRPAAPFLASNCVRPAAALRELSAARQAAHVSSSSSFWRAARDLCDGDCSSSSSYCFPARTPHTSSPPYSSPHTTHCKTVGYRFIERFSATYFQNFSTCTSLNDLLNIMSRTRPRREYWVARFSFPAE